MRAKAAIDIAEEWRSQIAQSLCRREGQLIIVDS